MNAHPVTKLFPPMSEAEFGELKASIAANGQRVPVLTWKDKILDGVHRDRACTELGLPVKCQEWDGQGSMVAVVVDLNRHRRHLSQDQRAAIAAEIAKAMRDETLEKQKQQGNNGSQGGRGKKKTLVPNSAQGFDDVVPKSRDVAGEKMGVGHTKVQEAKKILEKAPELHEKVKAGEMTHAQARRVLARQEKEAELNRKAQQAEENPQVASSWKLTLGGDCLVETRHLQKGDVRLVFADPPYNIGVDYGTGKNDDLLPPEAYVHWCFQWMKEIHRVLVEDGSFWLLISDEFAAQLYLEALKVGFHRRQWLIWYESFGVNNPSGFNRTHRHLFWFVKDPKKFIFNPDAVNRPSDREAKYGDKRAQPGGKTWDSVWGINPPIPRLVDNAEERIPGFPTQLPLALLLPIIGCASDPGDLILDPFSGSGTTGVAAIRLGRRYLGFEKNLQFAQWSQKRLLAEKRLP